MRFVYKEIHSFRYRRGLGERFRTKHPDKVPVIVEKGPKARIGNQQIKKYLIPYECTFGHLYFLVRKQLELRPETALILFVQKVIPSSSATMGSVYHNYCDSDLLLYVCYQDESVYGGEVPSDDDDPNDQGQQGQHDENAVAAEGVIDGAINLVQNGMQYDVEIPLIDIADEDSSSTDTEDEPAAAGNEMLLNSHPLLYIYPLYPPSNQQATPPSNQQATPPSNQPATPHSSQQPNARSIHIGNPNLPVSIPFSAVLNPYSIMVHQFWSNRTRALQFYNRHRTRGPGANAQNVAGPVADERNAAAEADGGENAAVVTTNEATGDNTLGSVGATVEGSVGATVEGSVGATVEGSVGVAVEGNVGAVVEENSEENVGAVANLENGSGPNSRSESADEDSSSPHTIEEIVSIENVHGRDSNEGNDPDQLN